MKVKDLIEKKTTSFSFEFFPPKTEEGWNALFRTIQELQSLSPTFVSVTYGAGGGTRENTHKLILQIRNQTNLAVVSHLTAIGSTEEEMHKILSSYQENNISNILALRGDPPKNNPNFNSNVKDFVYAKDLIVFIKKYFPKFCIGVAGYPEGHVECTNRIKEIDYLKEKIDVGADFMITQLFFDNHDYYDFAQRCLLNGITIPIIAGIMPITTKKGMLHMAELSARTRFPAKLLKNVLRTISDKDVEQIGIDWAVDQVVDLIHNNIKGIHFYTLNHAKSTLKIYEHLQGKYI